MSQIIGVEWWEAYRYLDVTTETGAIDRDEQQLELSPFPAFLFYNPNLPKRVEGDVGVINVDTTPRLRTDAPPTGIRANDVVIRQSTGTRYLVLRARPEDGDFVIYLEEGATPPGATRYA